MDNILTKENIFSLLDQETIIRKYFPGDYKLKKKVCNPFRNDSDAGCYFNWTRNNILVLFDHSHPEKGGNPINIVMLALNLDYKQALERINNDFGLGLISFDKKKSLTPLRKPVKTANFFRDMEAKFKGFKKVHYKIETREWTVKDGSYWKDRYGVGCKLLMRYNVHPVSRYFMRKWNEATFNLRYTHKDKDPCYCAQFKEKKTFTSVKLYQPLTLEFNRKWGGNVSSYILQGYDQLPETGDLLVISSSLKDLLVLVNIGYNSVAPQGESVAISNSKMLELKRRFKRVVVLYDKDAAGKRESKKLAKAHDIEFAELPNIEQKAKDISDYRNILGSDKEIKKIIDKIFG